MLFCWANLAKSHPQPTGTKTMPLKLQTIFMYPLVALFGLCQMTAQGWQDGFPEPKNSEKNPGQPMPAQEAAKRFSVPDGLKVTVFASEPLVRNPIAATFAPDGKLWVAENYTYAERELRFDPGQRDRVLVLTDTDKDGQADQSEVFLDNLQRLSSVEVGLGGVWLLCPPRLFFVPNQDGDSKPDGPARVVLEGFDVPLESHHNFANGLKWGPDGWLYGRCGASAFTRVRLAGQGPEESIPVAGGIWRFHPKLKVFEPLCHGTTNPWGHAWDAKGECFFVNTVNGHLWQMIPGGHCRRPHTVSPNPLVYEPLEMIADHWHFDTGKGWTSSRDAGGGSDDLGGGHAHSGALIYQGAQWPEAFRGKLLTLNFHGRRVNVEKLVRQGAGFVGKHEPDILQSADPFFRGIDLMEAPDGAVLILDWSDIGECHDATGVHRTSGRIFRVVGKGSGKSGPASGVESRLRDLWQKHSLGKTTWDHLEPLISDPEEAIRVWAVRLLLDAYPLDTVEGKSRVEGLKVTPEILHALQNRAKTDSSAMVRLALASSLGRLPVRDRAGLARELLGHSEDATDANLSKLIWYGLIPVALEQPADLVDLAVNSRLPRVREWISRSLAERVISNPVPLNQLLESAAKAPEAIRREVLAGLAAGFVGTRKAPEPLAWAEFKRGMTGPEAVARIRVADVVFGNGRALDELRDTAMDSKADMNSRRLALAALIEANPDDMRKICEKLLTVRSLNAVALEGLTRFDDPDLGKRITAQWSAFYPIDRPGVVRALASRPKLALPLLEAIESGRIPKDLLTASLARQIDSLASNSKDSALAVKLNAVWGTLRVSPAEKLALMEQIRAIATPEALAKADSKRGKELFAKACASCHRLFGEGADIGPDLTGSGRKDLDYLITNIVDPGAVLAAEYRVSVVEMKDGRILSGVVQGKSNRGITVQTDKEKRLIPGEEISAIRSTNQSLMPEGLLGSLKANETLDLIKFLMAGTSAQ